MKRAESSTVEGSALSFIGDRAPSSPDSSGGRGASGHPPLNIRRAAELPRTAGGYRAGIGTEPTTTGALPRHPHRFRHGSCQPPVHASGTDADFGTVPPRRLPSDASPAPARLLSRPELRCRDSGPTARPPLQAQARPITQKKPGANNALRADCSQSDCLNATH